uniref:Derlin n=1 Tax=Equus asinus asinus TaxID=83772 RepID=A0A8C4MR98_EQUAS
TGWRGLAAECLQVLAVTRACTAACVLTIPAVPELQGPFQPYCNPHLVSGSSRCGGPARPAYRPPLASLGLVTNLPFFGPLGFCFFFNMLFLYPPHCRPLEEGFFRGCKADFVFLFLFGGVLMTVSFRALHCQVRRLWVLPCCPGARSKRPGQEAPSLSL